VHHQDAKSAGDLVYLQSDVKTVDEARTRIMEDTKTQVTELWTITNQRPTRVLGHLDPFIALKEEQDTFPAESVAQEFAARGMR